MVYVSKEIKALRYINRTNNDFITNDRVRCLLLDYEENLWIGTQNGLCRIATNSSSSDNDASYLYDRANASGDDIINLFMDKDGDVWVSTKEKWFVQGSSEQLKKCDLA